jgi:hypothetical protein
MAKKNLKEQLSDILEIKIRLINLIYIYTKVVSPLDVYHAYNRIKFSKSSFVLWW